MSLISSKKYYIEAIITIILLSVGLLLSIYFGDLGHAVIIAGLLFIYLILFKEGLITFFFSFLFVFLTVLMVLGSQGVFSLYERFFWYDKPIHFTAEFLLTLLAGHILLTKKLIQVKNKLIFFIVVVSIGVALGGVWEVVEWFLNLMKPALHGYTATDTAMDLMVDTLGSLAATVIYVNAKREDYNFNYQ